MKKLIYCIFVLFCITLLFSAGQIAKSSEESGKNVKVGNTEGIVKRDNIDSALNDLGITKEKEFSVTFEDGVINIDFGAFFNCTGLTSVVIPGSVSVVGREVFMHCEGLKTVVIQNGVSTIKGQYPLNLPDPPSGFGYAAPMRGAFAGCKSLESLYIPESVTNIEENALWNYRIECPPNLTIYGSEGSYAQKYALENSIPFVSAAVPTESPTPTTSPTNSTKLELKVNTKKVTTKTTKITVMATKGATVSISAKGLKAKVKKVKMKEKKYTFQKLNFKKVKKGAKITCKATLKNHKSKTVTLKRE